MKKTGKLISLLLAVLMIVSSVSAINVAFAAGKTYNAKDYVSQYVVSKRVRSDGRYDTFSYDSNGNLIKEVEKDNYGNTSTWTNSYDSKGNPIKAVCKNSDGETDTYTNSYDSKGNLIKSVCKNSYFGNYVYTNSYDSNDNLIKEVYKRSDGYTETWTNSYDSKGNPIKKARKDSDGETETLTYSYKKLNKTFCLIDNEIKLSKYSYTYDGKAKEPSVYIDGYNKGVDYKVSYKNNVKVGTAQIIITFIGRAPVTIKYKITPAKVTNFKAMLSGKKINFTWNSVKGANGYEVQYYNNSSKKWVTCAWEKLNSWTVEKTSYWKGYSSVQLRVRAFYGNPNQSYSMVYGAFSDIVTLKTK